MVAILSSADHLRDVNVDHLRDVNVDHLRDAISQNAIIWTLLVVSCELLVVSEKWQLAAR